MRPMLQGLFHVARRFGAFARDRRAAVSIVAALSLPTLIAFSSLVAEYGHGLLVKTENQRVADMAAYAGALAYNSNGTTTAMTSAANAVAALNGIPTGNVSASLVNSPTGDGNQAVQVTVSSSLPLYLASVVGGSNALPVSSASYAELNVQTSGCSVASNNSEAVPCGTTITTKWVSYNSAAPTVGCGGITVNFNTGGSASTTYNFSGSINNTGTAMTFGPGTYNIAGGLITGGGTTTTFGAGTFNIGRSSSSCSGATYSICNTGTLLTFGGPSSFTLQGGVYNSGGSKLVLGSSGTGNSFLIGPSSGGNALLFGGGATIQFGDATDAGSLFQVVGNFVAAGGGSCTTIGAAAQHDIQGYFLTAGGTTLGSGVYSVTDYVDLGGSAGGDVSCNGSTVGMNGTGVTWVIGGASTPGSGTCSGQTFCLAAGYNHVNMTAPASGTTQGLVVIGPASHTGGALFAEGASNTSLSGAFYFPQGSISLTGGASVGGGAGQCLELIGTQVALSGGTAAASNCVGGGAGNVKIALVQ